jgi:hypothetical protein
VAQRWQSVQTLACLFGEPQRTNRAVRSQHFLQKARPHRLQLILFWHTQQEKVMPHRVQLEEDSAGVFLPQSM